MLPVFFGRGRHKRTSKNIPLSCIINIFITWKMSVRLCLLFSFNVTWQGQHLACDETLFCLLCNSTFACMGKSNFIPHGEASRDKTSERKRWVFVKIISKKQRHALARYHFSVMLPFRIGHKHTWHWGCTLFKISPFNLKCHYFSFLLKIKARKLSLPSASLDAQQYCRKVKII